MLRRAGHTCIPEADLLLFGQPVHPVRQDLHTQIGQDRFGMKLDTQQRQAAMRQRHYCPVCGIGNDIERRMIE